MGNFQPYGIAYLNGNQKLFYVLNSEENLETIIKQNLNSFPKDTMIVSKGHEKKISEINENDKITDYFLPTIGMFFFSHELYSKSNEEKNPLQNYNINDYKLIENHLFFKLYEYPQNKDIEDYYELLIFGEKKDNFNFINGFLNFLLGIKKETQLRFMLKEEKDDFIQEYYIQNNKGNFKFIFINSDFKEILSEKEFEQLLNILKNEKINMLIFNKNFEYMKSRYSKGSFYDIFPRMIKYNKNDLFFVNPNILCQVLKGGKLPKIEDKDKNKKLDPKQLEQLFDNIENSFFSEFVESETIFEDNRTYLNICYYLLSMKGYNSLYETLIKRGKKTLLEFDGCQNYLNKYVTHKKEIKESIEKKQNPLEIKKQKEKIAPIESKKKNEKKELEKINNKINSFISTKSNILKNEFFLIPMFTTQNGDKKYVNSKTNVCHICKFNCELDCHKLLKTSSKSFDWSFRCKNCPNKCRAKYHELVEFEYPKYEYKTIDNILDSFNIDKNISVDLKIKKVLDKMEEEKKEVENKISKLQDEINSITNVEIKTKLPESRAGLFCKNENNAWYNLALSYVLEENLKPNEEVKMRCSIM